jgi:phytoene dehydrogenase-like protein
VGAERVVIVGGGLAGLACATHLRRAGTPFVLLEASDAVGGRVRTDRVDGFLLDRGFQALLTSYPEAQRQLDLAALGLRELYPGALVRAGGRFHRVADPFRRPLDALLAARAPIARPRDYLALARLRGRVRKASVEQILSRRETSAIETLRAAGLSERLVERFFRPFLGGVFLEPDLLTSSRMLDFVLLMFGSGYAALPARGMGAVPAQLARGLPGDAIHLGARVDAVEETTAVLASGERVEGRALVVATEGPEAARLLPGRVSEPGSRSVTCLYFAADRPPLAGPFLVLDGEGEGPVSNLCVLSETAPSYAPPGQALVSASVLGIPAEHDEILEQRVRQQLAAWFGTEVERWRHLRTYRIDHALPALEPPAFELEDRAVRLGPGLYVCGDHRDTASIQGALVSGRRAAQAVVEQLSRSGGR